LNEFQCIHVESEAELAEIKGTYHTQQS